MYVKYFMWFGWIIFELIQACKQNASDWEKKNENKDFYLTVNLKKYFVIFLWELHTLFQFLFAAGSIHIGNSIFNISNQC